MNKTNRTHRVTILALSASLVLPIAPVLGQAQPVAVAPPSPVSAAPPPVRVAPPPPVAVTPPPAARPAPPVARVAQPEAAPATRETRTVTRETRTVTRATRPAPSPRAAAPQAAPPPAAEPAPAPVAEAPPPVEATPAITPPPPVETTTATDETQDQGGSSLPWLIAGLALLAGLVAFALLRRRRSRDEVFEERVEEQPVLAEAPVVVAEPEYQPAIVAPLPSFHRAEPVLAAEAEEIVVESDVEEVVEVETNAADVAALGAADTTHRDRPWLEMLLRPIRAGANGDDTVVEFSLTVGNTGGIPAEDVRISAWMLGTQGSEAEGLLIEPPAGSTLSETRIEAGDGATVEATVSMPREGFDRAMLPIVVTDARYTLPDGGEGRTSACFAVGLPIGEELVPFPANAASGLNEGVEARVHCEVEHV